MWKLHGLWLVSVIGAVALVTGAVAHSRADKPSHSAFHREFSQQGMVRWCQHKFKFVKEKCAWRTSSGAFGWQGEKDQEDFNYFDLTGDLSEDQVKQLLGALKAEMVRLARANKAVLSHDPKDSIVDRPMRLLQPGLISPANVRDTAVIPSSLRGFYFPYKDGKVEGWVDVFAIRIVRDKRSEWLVLGAVHEFAR